jgi:hypothetical protein
MKIEAGEIIQMHDLRLFVVTEVRPKEVVGMNLGGKGTKYRIKHKDVARTVGLITEDLDALFTSPEREAAEAEADQSYARDMVGLTTGIAQKGWKAIQDLSPGDMVKVFLSSGIEEVRYDGFNPRAKKYPVMISRGGKAYKVAIQSVGAAQ